ncbi:MAG: hypothetical protein PHE58_01900 [Candidatus Omnitrophica bacterium]|nr:hypothetical protein [Candidatus Omnitrophota bacterium]
MDQRDEKNLQFRYLIWLYKTTKEAFDRYERKFTQIELDEYILRTIEQGLKEAYLPAEKKAFEKYVNSLRAYIAEKENACLKLKYKGKKINPEFLFLDVKLNAIEKTIVKMFGKQEFDRIRNAYHQETVRRILEDRREQEPIIGGKK